MIQSFLYLLLTESLTK